MRYLGILSLLILIATTAFAQQIKTEKHNQAFFVKGDVFPKNTKSRSVNVLVYKDNTIVDEMRVRRNGRFKAALGAGAYYTLVFQSEGYVAKKVIVETIGLADGAKPRKNSFEFDVVLKSENFLDELAEEDAFTFPTAWIRYNAFKGVLMINMPYTLGIHKAQTSLLGVGLSNVNFD